MSKCAECGHDDWTYYHCEYDNQNLLIEACRYCTTVKPDGLVEQLTEHLTDKITEQLKGEMDIEVQLETLSDKIARIDEITQRILSYLESEDE